MFEKRIKELAKLSGASVGVSTLSLVTALLTEPNFASLYVAAITMATGIYGFSGIIKMKNTDKRIEKTVNSDEYKEYISLYGEYVKDIAKLFKDLGYEDALATSMVYRFCLEKGFFSKDLVFKQIAYKKYFDQFFYDVLGAVVSTGEACCRHTSSLLTDVINEMGGVAANLCVVRTNREDKKNKSNYANHMVTGLIHNDKKLIVDSMISFMDMPFIGLGFFDDLESTKDGTISAYCPVANIEFLKKRALYDNYEKNANRIEGLMQYPNFTEYNEFLDVYFDTISKCGEQNDAFTCFAHDEQPKIKRMALLSGIIAPHE